MLNLITAGRGRYVRSPQILHSARLVSGHSFDEVVAGPGNLVLPLVFEELHSRCSGGDIQTFHARARAVGPRLGEQPAGDRQPGEADHRGPKQQLGAVAWGEETAHAHTAAEVMVDERAQVVLPVLQCPW